MAQEVDRFWTTSGRIDTFEYEMVAANNFNKSMGFLSGVTGGKLTFGYDTDLKVSGSLEISTTEFFENCVIRIHYKPRLSASQKKDIVLATCYAYTGKMTFEKGRYHGTIELVSILSSFKDDVLQSNFTIGKNKTYKNELARLIKATAPNIKYKFVSGVKDKKNTSAVLTERNKPPMDVIQIIADGLDARVDVDPYGTLVLEKYYAPSKKTCTLKLPTGQYSVTLPKVEMEENTPEMPNRIAYHCDVSWKQTVYVLDKKGRKQKYTSGANKGKYQTKTETKKKTIIGKAVVKTSNPLHYNNRGRWVTQVFTYSKTLSAVKLNETAKLNAQLDKIKKEADNKAAKKLSSLTSGIKRYTIECFYLPIVCGQVVEFEYIASGIKLHVQAMVENIELELGVGGKMKVTLKHVRKV